MREIKFRSWDGQKMREWGFVNGGFYSPPSESGGHAYPHMQFTGLKDKSGKEIYEGDIIGMSPKWKYEVVWSDEKARWALRSTFAVPHANGKRAAKVFQALTNATTRPVIGNIYENPDLLSV